MDLTKKRKADENGRTYHLTSELNNTMGAMEPTSTGACSLSPEDAEKILEPFTKEQLLPILRTAILRHHDVLDEVRAVADADPAQRKLFVRGLGWETTTEKLRQVFSAYGELDETNTIIITDKSTGKSKGYGFVTFKHIDAAFLALKEPNKKIDGRITATHLASVGSSGNPNSTDVALRKIYVGNIPFELPSERLLTHFSMYGAIEEGPLGFDQQPGKAKGFAFFVYKSEEGSKAALVDPIKTIDGHQIVCKLAIDNRRQKPNAGPAIGVPPGPVMPNSGPMGVPPRNYPMGGFAGYAQAPNMPPSNQTGMMHQNASYSSLMGGPGGPGGQGYSSGYGGVASGYDGMGGAGSGEYGSMANAAYKMPPSSMGLQGSGVYPTSGNYGPPAGYLPQPNLPVGPGPRFHAYQSMPPH